MGIFQWSHLDSNAVIASKFRTWHGSCVVMVCAKICSDMMTSDYIAVSRIFHCIWIASKKCKSGPTLGRCFFIDVLLYGESVCKCSNLTIGNISRLSRHINNNNNVRQLCSELQHVISYISKQNANSMITCGCFNIDHDDVIKWKHFRVTGLLCGEFTGYRWIPYTKASDAELWCFLRSAPE